MRVTCRFYLFVWMVLLTFIFVIKTTEAQLTPVNVGAGVVVQTTINLPVNGDTNPDYTYIKVRADLGLTPTFKIYPDGGTITNALNQGTTGASIIFGGIYIGDVQLSVDATTNVYTLDVSHYNDQTALGTNSDGVLDDWILEISHGATESHKFHFAVGHTEAAAMVGEIELRPPRPDIDPVDGIDFTKSDAGQSLKIIVKNTRELNAIVKNIGTGTLTLNSASIQPGGACSDFSVGSGFLPPYSLQPNAQQTIPIQFTPQSIGLKNCNGLTANGSYTDHNGTPVTITSNTLRLLGSGHEVEVVLLLDASGSMGDAITSGKRRWDAAVEAAGEFLTLLSQLDAGQGKYGVITFPDPIGAEVSSKSVTSMRVIIPNDVSQSRLDLNAMNPNGWTPMGHGIGRAISDSRLGLPPFISSNTDNVRIVCLLSDGEHNRPVNGAFPAPADFYTDLTNNNIQVYTIIYGNPGEPDYDPMELQALSAASGVPQTGPNSYPMPKEANTTNAYDLRKNFKDFLLNFEGLFLSHVFDPAGYVGAGNEKKHNVSVEAGDDAVAFILDWTTWQTDRLSFELITPDCQVITPQVAAQEIDIDYASSDRYKIYTVKGSYLRDPKKHGIWQLRILGDHISSGGENYTWDVMKKSSLLIEPRFDKGSYFTGESMKIRTRLTDRGQALLGANVKVSLNKPSNSFNNYIAYNFVSQAELAQVPDSLFLSTDIAKKSYVLQKIKHIPFDFAYLGTDIQLYDDGTHGDEIANDGVYTNTFSNTSIPGCYHFFFSASGISLDGVQFTRQQNLDVFVNTPFNRNYLNVVYNYKRFIRDGQPFTRADVTLVARDAFGNAIIRQPYLKPIQVMLEGAEKDGDLVNNLDGTFTQRIIYPTKAEPKIRFQIGKNVIATKKGINLDGLKYVDNIVNFKPGSSGNGKNLFIDPKAALGPPDLSADSGYVSLGIGGSLTLKLSKQVLIDGPGDDITVFETEEGIHPGIREIYKVEVKPVNSEEFIQLGKSLDKTSSFDLSDIGIKAVDQIRITDLSGRPVDSQGHWSNSPGVDIDAIGFKYFKNKETERRFFLVPFAGYFSFNNNLTFEDNFVYGGRIGHSLSGDFEIEAEAGITSTKDSAGTKGTILQANVSALYNFAEINNMKTFARVGLGLVNFNKFLKTGSAFTVNGGVGAYYNPAASKIAFRADIGDYIIFSDPFNSKTTHNLQATLGIVFRF